MHTFIELYDVFAYRCNDIFDFDCILSFDLNKVCKKLAKNNK